jgi:integrase
MTKQITKQNKDFQFYSKKELSSKTKENYSNSVKSYLRFIKDHNINMGFDSVMSWLKTIKNPRSHNLGLQGLKAYLLKYYENESPIKILELHQGFERIKRKKPDMAVDEHKYITYQEYENIIVVDSIEKLKPYFKKRNEISGYTDVNIKKLVLIIQALYWTGCRISELLNIEVKDCQANGHVTIRIVGKGSKERNVFLQNNIFQEVKKTFKGQTFLFETRAGTRLDRLNVTKDIHRFAKKILRRNISAHTMRHSKAMYLKDVQHLSPDQVAKALGHSSVVTCLQHYYHGTPDATAQGII